MTPTLLGKLVKLKGTDNPIMTVSKVRPNGDYCCTWIYWNKKDQVTDFKEIWLNKESIDEVS